MELCKHLLLWEEANIIDPEDPKRRLQEWLQKQNSIAMVLQ